MTIPQLPPPTENCAYGISPSEMTGLKWSGKIPIPTPGMRVWINFNSLNWGEVIGYFKEYEWLGVIVKLDKAPAWHKKQNKGKWNDGLALVFGVEVQLNDAR